MKRKRKLRAVAVIVCLLLSVSALLSSCGWKQESAGIVGADINENGELILQYTDGTVQNLGVVVGADGQNGIDGTDGEDGEDGEDGANGQDGADGSLLITNDESGISAACAKGLRSAVSIVCNFKRTVQQGGFFPGSGSTSTQEYSSAGSGVIYRMDRQSGDAFIITNYHVVYDASSNTANGISDDIYVYLYGSEREDLAIKASYVGGSLYYDVAVLLVEDSELLRSSSACAVDVADSDAVAVGDRAIAIGNAKGYGIAASLGIVSVDSEHITMIAADEKTEVSFRVMRVDTAVNSGNSGGGLYDDEGCLIGIVNAKFVDEGVENIGYAIPSGVAVSVAENIIEYCYGTSVECVQRALLGITVVSADSRAVYDSQTGKLAIKESVLVYEVSNGSLADGILQVRDVLLGVSVNGGETVEITRQYHVIDMMLDVRAGDTVTFSILRGGLSRSVSLVVTEECLVAY